MSFDSMNAVARKKLGKGDDWSWFKFEVITGGTLLEGSHCHKDGKGKMHWNKPSDKVIITHEECEAADKEYEETTGNCPNCEGTGIETYGWDHIKGTLTRPCKRCGGNNFGRPPKNKKQELCGDLFAEATV